MDKFHQFVTKLSAHEMIIEGYYRFTFFIYEFMLVAIEIDIRTDH